AKTKLKLAIAAAGTGMAVIIALAAPSSLGTGTTVSAADAGSNYAKYCTRCHGADGKGQTPKGRQTNAGDLTKSKMANATGIRLIANGKELMPGFSGNMTAEEIKELMNFVRGFRR
ncbi:MAG TPA: cytochrome c, partial [Pyrinomonadaceae bacterium]|nr:cytochrome c [Pyrinomonadaceae bacterium]